MYRHEVEWLINDGRCQHFSGIDRFLGGGSQKGKSSYDDEYGHGWKKRRPSTYVVEITVYDNKVFLNLMHVQKMRLDVWSLVCSQI